MGRCLCADIGNNQKVLFGFVEISKVHVCLIAGCGLHRRTDCFPLFFLRNLSAFLLKFYI